VDLGPLFSAVRRPADGWQLRKQTEEEFPGFGSVASSSLRYDPISTSRQVLGLASIRFVLVRQSEGVEEKRHVYGKAIEEKPDVEATWRRSA